MCKSGRFRPFASAQMTSWLGSKGEDMPVTAKDLAKPNQAARADLKGRKSIERDESSRDSSIHLTIVLPLYVPLADSRESLTLRGVLRCFHMGLQPM